MPVHIRNPVPHGWNRLDNNPVWPLAPGNQGSFMHPLQVHTKESYIQKVIPGIGISLDPKMLGKGPGTYTVTRDGKVRTTQQYIQKEAQIIPPSTSSNSKPGGGLQTQPVNPTVNNTTTPSTPPAPAPTPAPTPTSASTPTSATTPGNAPVSNNTTPASTGVSSLPNTTPTQASTGVSNIPNTGSTPASTGVSSVSSATTPAETGVSSPSASAVPSQQGLVGTPQPRRHTNPYTYLPQLPDRSTWYTVMGTAAESSYRQLQMLYDNHPQLVANSRIPQLMAQIGSEARSLQSVDTSRLNPYELRMYNTRVSRLNGFKQELQQEIQKLTNLASTYRQLQSKYPALSDQHLSFAAGVLSNKSAIENTQRRAEEMKRLAYDRLLRGEIDENQYNQIVGRWDNAYRNAIARTVGSIYGVSPEEVTPDLIDLAQNILKNPNELPRDFVNSRVLEGYVSQFQPVSTPNQPSAQQAAEAPAASAISSAPAGSEPAQSSWSGIQNPITYAEGMSARQYRERAAQRLRPQQVQADISQQTPFTGGMDLSQIAMNPMMLMMMSGIDPIQMMFMQGILNNPQIMEQFQSFLQNLFSGFQQSGGNQGQAATAQQQPEPQTST